MGEIVVNNSIYWDTQEVINHLVKVGSQNGSTYQSVRKNFYRNIRKKLYPYHFYDKSKPWYRKSEVIALAEGEPEEHPHIVIKGLLAHWTRYAESLGLNVETINRTIEIGVPLPAEICKWIGVSETTPFVKRSRMTFLDGVPVTAWYTAYPLVLVGDFLDQIKHDSEFDIPAALKQARGIKPAPAMDSPTARQATLFEQELFQMKRPEAVMNLQRAVYSEQERLLWFSEMTLRAGRFQLEYHYTFKED